MKIHIIGGSGSGKSYLAAALSKKYGIPSTSLDNLFWDNSAGGYNKKRNACERDAMLSQVLEQSDWIIEGVQYSWLGESFAAADRIYLIKISPALCRRRIIRRFIKRKFSKSSRKNETIKSLTALLKWTKKFYKVNMPEIESELLPYAEKVVILSDKRQIQSIICGN